LKLKTDEKTTSTDKLKALIKASGTPEFAALAGEQLLTLHELIGKVKVEHIVAQLQAQIEMSTYEQEQERGKTPTDLYSKKDMYNAKWYGTAHWRQEHAKLPHGWSKRETRTEGGKIKIDYHNRITNEFQQEKPSGNNEWKFLQDTIKSDTNLFTGNMDLMSQQEEGENDAIHVHQNILNEFYKNNRHMLRAQNVTHSKLVAGGNGSVQVCIKTIDPSIFPEFKTTFQLFSKTEDVHTSFSTTSSTQKATATEKTWAVFVDGTIEVPDSTKEEGQKGGRKGKKAQRPFVADVASRARKGYLKIKLKHTFHMTEHYFKVNKCKPELIKFLTEIKDTKRDSRVSEQIEALRSSATPPPVTSQPCRRTRTLPFSGRNTLSASTRR